jgi:hypothetical protein
MYPSTLVVSPLTVATQSSVKDRGQLRLSDVRSGGGAVLLGGV